MINSFLVALQFLTRIPVSLADDVSDDEARNSVLYYALVGLVIGVILVFAAWLSAAFDEEVIAAIVTTLWIIITGALHLDGLADSADAWLGGHGNKEKTLTIMKDPYCGPAGVVTLVALLLLKFSLLVSLLDDDILIALLLAPVIGRFCASWLFHTTPYVRENGLGSTFSGVEPGNHYLITATVIVLALFWSLGFSAIATIALLLVVFFILRDLMIKRLDGITGDTTGAMIEIIEVTLLFAFVMFH